MNIRTWFPVCWMAGQALVTSLPARAADIATPPLQRAECSADGRWVRSAGGVELSCAGDVWLSGGTWESESAIVVRAEGLIWLRDISITAPGIDLQASSLRIDSDARLTSTGGAIRLATQGAGGTLTLDGILSVAGQVVSVSGGAIQLQPGQSMVVLPDRTPVLSPVPEPETLVMWLAGLGVLVVPAWRKRHAASAVGRSMAA